MSATKLVRRAACSCGGLVAECRGEPVRVSVCHCFDCQQRSGSAFAAQARYATKDVKVVGEHSIWTRTGEGGRTHYHFCPTCGSTVLFVAEVQPKLIAVAVGAFADADFPAPTVSLWEERRHPWAAIAGKDVEHIN